MNKMNKTILAIVFIIIAIVLSIISYLILPDNVITQIKIGDDDVTETPKLLAIIVPFLFTIIGGILLYINRYKEENEDNKSIYKYSIMSIIGIVIFIFMIIVNA